MPTPPAVVVITHDRKDELLGTRWDLVAARAL